jgi:hydroxymethylbilane synthase
VLACVPERADPRDVLVGCRLDELGPGVTVATGSVRRQAQLADRVDGLRFVDLRGNIHTRLSKLPEGGALVMAAAALERLGLASAIADTLEPDVMVPQVAQGALAIECRDDDAELREVLAALEDEAGRAAVDAERAFLAAFGAGCDLPVGAYAAPDGTLRTYARFTGGRGYTHRATGTWERDDPSGSGRQAGEAALAAARTHGAH